MERDFYGALINDRGQIIVHNAINLGIIPPEYCTIDRKHRGSARSYAIYDRAKNEILVQRRDTTCTRYGNSPRKSYLALTVNLDGTISYENFDKYKAKIVKLAKSVQELGDVLAVLRNEKQIKIRTKINQVHIVYKAVALVDNKYLSIYDGKTEYIIGKEMTQAARANHCGGFYTYPTIEDAKNCNVPNNSALLNEKRVVLKLSATGQSVYYGNGKTAYTKVIPIECVEIKGGI